MRTDITHRLQDYTHLNWAEGTRPSTTSGTFLKAKSGAGNNLMFYKLSNYDSYRGVFGHECVNELIASRLLDQLGFPHVRYRLIHAHVLIGDMEQETWLNASRSFRPSGTQKMRFDVFFDLYKQPGETPFSFCERYGWGEFINQLILVDYLIINRDRHGANIEVIQSRDGSFHPAPLFDNGLSFVFSTYGDDARIEEFNPLEDVPCNNYFGYRSVERNLEFLPKGFARGALDDVRKDVLFNGLDEVISPIHREKIWEIVTRRWEHYESL